MHSSKELPQPRFAHRIVVPAIDAHRHPGQAKREPGSQKIGAAIYYDPGSGAACPG
jgi:hypothetical protein